MAIKYFEEIDINKVDDYYAKDIEVGPNLINVDLNFEDTKLDSQQVHKLNSFFNNINNIIDKSWKWIMDDYKNGNEVKEYISFHLDADDTEELLAGTDSSLSNEDRFFQTLRVQRIGVYPSSPENYLVIDWMTNPELSNYILVINVNENFELDYITMES